MARIRSWTRVSGRSLLVLAALWVGGLVPLGLLVSRAEESSEEVTFAENLLGVWYAVWLVLGAALVWMAMYLGVKAWRRQRARRAE